MGHPTLRCSFEGGNPNKSKELRYLVGYKLLLSAPTSIMSTFALRNVQTTLGKMSMMSLLMLWTISFWVDKMMPSLKYSLVCEVIFPIPLYATWMSDSKFGPYGIVCGKGMLPFWSIGMWPLPTLCNQFTNC